MAAGKSGYFDIAGSHGFSIRIEWSEEYNIQTNTSSLSITSVKIQSTQYARAWFPDGTISVDGNVVKTMENSGYATHAVYLAANDNWVELYSPNPGVHGEDGFPWSAGEISHNADGSKNVTFSVDLSFWRDSTTTASPKITGSNVVTLTTIPRASELSVSNGTLGTAQTLTVTKKSSSFTDTITYTCGSESGTIATKSSATSISWTPPLSLASQNAVGTTVAVTFTMQTYSGNTAVGSAVKKSVNMAIPASVKPSCTLTVSDYMGYATTYGAYVKGLSRLQVKVTPTIAYGAEIVSYKTTANGSTYADEEFVTAALKSSGTLTISATVTDSRNRTSSAASKTITAIDYTAPAISKLTAVRCDANGTENSQGGYVKVTFSAAVSSLGNKNGAEYILNYKKSTAADWNGVALDELYGDYSVADYSYVFAADTGSSYNVEVTVEDNHHGTVKSTTAPTAFALLHPNPDGTGIALGKVCEKSNAVELGLTTYDKFGTLMGNGLAAYTGGGDDGIDPDTTLEELCLTSHTNAPQGLGTFYYIRTTFYNTKSTTAARSQIAHPYNKAGSIYYRYYASGAWSKWESYACYTDMMKAISADNLLRNSNFLNPVNQLGATTATGNGFITIDEWRTYFADTTVSVTDNGISVSSTGGHPNLYQVIDSSTIDVNKTYTCACEDSGGNVYVWSGKPSNTSGANPVCVYTSGTTVLFRLVKTATWKWAAMYEGTYTAANLPPYVPKAIEIERMACGLFPTLTNTLYGSASLKLAASGSSNAVAVLTDRMRTLTSDTMYLGDSTYKWKAVYAVNGTIQTSDRTQKKNITEIGDKYVDLFDKLTPVTFEFADAESDRIHIGYISQDVKAAMDEVGLTDLDFAGYCRDVKTTHDEESDAEIPVVDENGDPEYLYSLRYSEFIALNSKMIQLNRQKIAEQQQEIQALREELDALKAAISKLSN